MFNKTDPKEKARGAHPGVATPDPIAPLRKQDPTPIGASIHINGHVRGNEDLVVHGRIEGSIDIGEGILMLTREGQVDADVSARVINVEGRAKGNLQASDQITVRKTGRVRGNISAPRVALDFGCKFSGSIDTGAGEDSVEDCDATARDQNVADFKSAIASSARAAMKKRSPG